MAIKKKQTKAKSKTNVTVHKKVKKLDKFRHNFGFNLKTAGQLAGLIIFSVIGVYMLRSSDASSTTYCSSDNICLSPSDDICNYLEQAESGTTFILRGDRSKRYEMGNCKIAKYDSSSNTATTPSDISLIADIGGQSTCLWNFDHTSRRPLAH